MQMQQIENPAVDRYLCAMVDVLEECLEKIQGIQQHCPVNSPVNTQEIKVPLRKIIESMNELLTIGENAIKGTL